MAGIRPGVEALEKRNLLSVSATNTSGVLTVTGTPDRDRLVIAMDSTDRAIVVYSYASEIARFSSSSVNSIVVEGEDGDDFLVIDPDLKQPVFAGGGKGKDFLRGGAGNSTLMGDQGNDKLRAGSGMTILDGGQGPDLLSDVKPADIVIPDTADVVVDAIPPLPTTQTIVHQLDTNQVNLLLARAAAATASNDGIIAIVDRGGAVLGVRVESGVDPAITGNPDQLVFAIDGAIAKARTGAFFASNSAPLTSRTVQFISQTTMTQREIQSNPNIPDPNSTVRGPGFVAAIGIKSHFPPDVMFTPQVDLFAIEHTNRDSIINPGPDGVTGTADDLGRFNIDATRDPAIQSVPTPVSFGQVSGLKRDAQSRGIATLPGGLPVYDTSDPNSVKLIGGIGVFYPGKTGYATEENSSSDALYNPSMLDRSYEAEYAAFAALGGLPENNRQIGTLDGIGPVTNVGLPALGQNGRIDLVGITLDIFGPGGRMGPENLISFGKTLGTGNASSGFNPIASRQGKPVSEGWIVTPHDGVGITAGEVEKSITDGIAEANRVRAAIRLPLNSTTRMVFAVADLDGDIVGLYRMPDATVFSIDVAVAKARNVAYYASERLQPEDQLPGVAVGTALTSRSFRYLSLPRYPEGIDGKPPGPFSILNDGGVDPSTGLNVGPPLPASAYQSVQGYDAFNPGTNFRDPANRANQNGVVFFPGSAPLYRSGKLIGGYGVSGDGVDQDDVVTTGGVDGFEAPAELRIDQVFVRGVRVPYAKFNRNPRGGVTP